MNKKQRRTLAAIFADSVPAGIEWAAIESLLIAAGFELIEGRGSRVKFKHSSGVIASLHRPHPEKEAKRYQVRDAREFLEKIGVIHQTDDNESDDDKEDGDEGDDV